jgi:rod shape determining protein RodA
MIFIPVILLIGAGLLAIYSSTLNHPTAGDNFNKQLSWALIALAAFFITYFLPPRTFKLFSVSYYVLTIVLLVLVLIVGKTISGSKSWISFGSLGFQPSEFAKIGIILLMSYWLTKKDVDINSFKDLFLTLAMGSLPVLLILFEPDMGTAVVFIAIILTMIFWSGISLFGLFVVLAPGIIMFSSLFGTIPFIITLFLILIALLFFKQNLFTSATIFVVNLGAGFVFDILFGYLQPHQQKRIESFLDPNADPLGSGYNALQAKVAIGSGGFLGKGFLDGNQTQLRFIPEQWTDFIYCVIGEEFGFIGSGLIVILFIILLIRILSISQLINDKFGVLVLIGTVALLFSHFAINIGMNVGLTPVVGLPLPFLSYGGSSLIVNMILIGIIMNIYKNRKYHI